MYVVDTVKCAKSNGYIVRLFTPQGYRVLKSPTVRGIMDKLIFLAGVNSDIFVTTGFGCGDEVYLGLKNRGIPVKRYRELKAYEEG